MSNIDLELLTCFCDESVDLLNRWEKVCLQLETDPKTENWDELFRTAHNLKGTSRVVGLDAFGNFVHKIEDSIMQARSGAIPQCGPLVVQLLKAQAILAEWLQKVKSDVSYEPDNATYLLELKTATQAQQPETPPTKVDTPTTQHVPAASEPVPTPAGAVPRIETAEAPTSNAAPVPVKNRPQNSAVKDQRQATSIDETIRVGAIKLDALIQMIGELSIQISSVNSKQENEDPTTYLLKKMAKELYEKALSLRMQPLQPIFQRLDRNIRDISRSLEKKVEVQILGGEVELDKTVCERIIDPLTHMVRNSVDHGLETPEARLNANKEECGLIKITAVQDSSSVRIIIEDDGRGISEEKVLAKAIERGLIQPGQTLTKSEILNLIFLPGFSTAEKITEVSGRGVGMDVVMKTVEALRGQIHIESEAGRGSCFTVTLPTSLSLIDSLSIFLGDNSFAIPIDLIDEIIVLESLNTQIHNGVIRLRDEVIPIRPLSDYLRVSQNKKSQTSTVSNFAIVTKHQKQKVAFAVDKLGDINQVVVRPLNGTIDTAFGFSGTTVFSGGEPGLIVDLEMIARHFLNSYSPSKEAA